MVLTYSGKSKNIVHHVLNKVRVRVDFHDRKSTSGSQQPVSFLKNLQNKHPGMPHCQSQASLNCSKTIKKNKAVLADDNTHNLLYVSAVRDTITHLFSS